MDDAAKQLMDEGLALYQKSDFKGASEKFEEIVQEDQANWEAWRMLGFCLNTLEDYDRAAKAFEQAVLRHPNDADNHFGMAMAHLGKGDLTHAIPAFEQVLHYNPQHPAVKEPYSKALVKRGQEMEAAANLLATEQYFEKAYKVTHSEEDLKRLMDYYEKSGQGLKAESIQQQHNLRLGIKPEVEAVEPAAASDKRASDDAIRPEDRNREVKGTTVHDMRSAAGIQDGPGGGVPAAAAGSAAPVGQAGGQNDLQPGGGSGAAKPAGNYIPCVKCGKSMMATANMCPHCGNDIRKNSLNASRAAAERKTWQEVAYKVICWIWVIIGLLGFGLAFLATGGGGTTQASWVLLIYGGYVAMGVALLLEQEWAQFISFWLSAISMVVNAGMMLISIALMGENLGAGIVSFLIHGVQAGLAILFMYLLKTIGDV